MWLFPAVLFFIAADKPKLMKVKVNDDITVSVPKDWLPMEEEDIVQRYPSVRAPLMAYTNEERVADFSVNISATQWPDDDIELAKKFFKAGLMNVFDRVDMIDEGIHEVRGKKFIFFEFESRINGNRQQEGHDRSCYCATHTFNTSSSREGPWCFHLIVLVAKVKHGRKPRGQ